jgi:hypothetical protein
MGSFAKASQIDNNAKASRMDGTGIFKLLVLLPFSPSFSLSMLQLLLTFSSMIPSSCCSKALV